MRICVRVFAFGLAILVCAFSTPAWALGADPCSSKTSVQLNVSRMAIGLGEPTTVTWTYSAPADCRPTSVKIRYGDAISNVPMHTDVTDFNVGTGGSLIDHPQNSGWYSLQAFVGGSLLEFGRADVQVSLPSAIDITQPNQNGLFAQAIGQPNTLVRIAGTIDLDLSNMSYLRVAHDVSIVGDTSLNRAGPHLFTTSFPDVLLQVGDFGTASNNVHISGIQLDGGMPDDPYSAVGQNDASGIVVAWSTNVEIDHNELHHWRGAAVRVLDGNNADDPTFNKGVINRVNADAVRVHDNYIHHNQHPASTNCISELFGDNHAAGYGVEAADGAYVTIERNVFDFNRHAIAGDGKTGTGYLAFDNLILQHGGVHVRCVQNAGDVWDVAVGFLNPFEETLKLTRDLLDGDYNYHTHMIDMHGRHGSGYDSGPAGEFMEIADNTILYTAGNAIHLRGTPSMEMFVHDNVFAQKTVTGDWTKVGALVQNESGLQQINNTFEKNTFDERKSCDFDGDGVSDQFISTGIGWWYAATTLGGRWVFLKRASDPIGIVQLRDVDGDGRCDVVTPAGTFFNHDPQPLAISPGTISSMVGQPVSVDLHATGGSRPFTWQANGLPSGVVVDSAGHISGSAAPNALAASSVTATVTGSTGLRGSVVFTWTLSVSVPDLRGQAQSAAAGLLAPRGLHVGNVSTVMNCTIEPGTIMGQTPGAQAIVAEQSSVAISVSSLSDGQGHRCQLN